MNGDYIEAFNHGLCAMSALAGFVCGFAFWLWLFCKFGR